MFDEADHEVDRWGTADTKEDVPRRVVRLAQVMSERFGKAIPWMEAIANTRKAFVGQGCIEFFLTQPGRQAPLPLLRDDLWQSSVQSVSADDSGVLRTNTSWRRTPGSSPWADFDRPQGPNDWSNLLHFWECSLREQLRTDADLDRSDLLALRVALPIADAMRLFGGLTLVASAPELVSPRKPGERWTEAHRDALRAQHKSLIDGPRKLGVQAADNELADAWKMSASNVKAQRIKKVAPQSQRRAA